VIKKHYYTVYVRYSLAVPVEVEHEDDDWDYGLAISKVQKIMGEQNYDFTKFPDLKLFHNPSGGFGVSISGVEE
jgi:hypothetical protein